MDHHQQDASLPNNLQKHEERTIYSQVRYKKQEGHLSLSVDGITFTVSDSPLIHVAWNTLAKHQVSPASYPKALLKLVLRQRDGSSSNATFQFPQRSELERVRQEITARLTCHNNGNGIVKKRSLPSSTTASNTATAAPLFGGNLDPTALAVTRASLLAAHPSLRQQHYHLVQETETVSEDDFWETHNHLVQEEYARIAGMAKAGTSSLLQSHLPIAKGGRVKLGVEEMRQIFILYPAVHKAYEEKVPLELSDEQFWRKYLESEYFHRDRGRMGTAARNHSSGKTTAENTNNNNNNNKKQSGPSLEEQDARAAAVGTDDLFSRYAQKLKQERAAASAEEVPTGEGAPDRHRHQWGRQLAVGQFDLASTFETERGNLLEVRDNHPPNPDTDGKGDRVIRKYNRHWAMVLHPEEAVAGTDLTQVARKSAYEALPNDSDALAGGGIDQEMRRLVDFAQAPEDEANHAAGLGLLEAAYAPLNLKNVEGYYSGAKRPANGGESTEDANKRYKFFANAIATKTHEMALACKGASSRTKLPDSCFPEPRLGKKLLSALTRKMAADSRTESDSLEAVNKLPEDFRKRLHAYFRRSSELLRHFFGLRRLLEAQGTAQHSQKLARIVRGMETFYREMEGMRKEFPHTETGEMMRKMCLPIMDQLDWAFQLHREGSGGGGGGGFVAVEEIY